LQRVATAVQTGALIALHLLPTGYDPRRDAVSDYGVGRYRAWFSAQTIAGGLAGLALAIAFAETTPSIPTLVVVMLLISAVAPRLKERFGLIERLVYVSSIAWFFIVSIELARIAG
jgi:hypothetical protein